jgi:hypothetical protein
MRQADSVRETLIPGGSIADIDRLCDRTRTVGSPRVTGPPPAVS